MSEKTTPDRAELQKKSRALWEEVFAEDSPRFLDYYDRRVADHNRIYLDEERDKVKAMLHRNPYTIRLAKGEAQASYIVAVATRREYRHQGRMRRLLQTALADSYREEEPFVYLMPASERIYQPFDFRTVGYQNVLTLGSVFPAPGGLTCRPAREDQLALLAAFSERLLSGHCAVYASRTLAYFQRIWQEQEAVNGGILLFYRGSDLAGYCLSGLEDAAEVWELVMDRDDGDTYAQALHAVTEYFRAQLPLKVSGFLPGTRIAGISAAEFSYRPITMVRLTNLFALARRLRATEKIDVVLRLQDGLLAENNGRFRLWVTPQKGRLEKLEEAEVRAAEFLSAQAGNGGPLPAGAGGSLPAEVKLTVGELTDVIFQVRGKEGFPVEKLQGLHPVYLQELV